MFGALTLPSRSLSTRSTCITATCCSPPLARPAGLEARGGGGHRAGSLYEVLRVKHTATLTEIKAAYRSLAKVYHPDTNRTTEEGLRFGSDRDRDGDGGRDFIEIHDAYATLSDPAARAVYDLTLGFGRLGRFGVLDRAGGYRPTRRWETDQCW